MRTTLGWLWFMIVQLIMLAATLLGLFVLIYPCMKQSWVKDAKSIKDGRDIDRWSWRPANWIYGNPEDGVSGQTALVMVSPVDNAPYLPNVHPAWRAYRWSALRNSCDNLKYVFAWSGGPYAEFNIGPKRIRLGWATENGKKVPLL